MTPLAGQQLARVWMRPRYEGANIRTWVGFKHLMYLVEEAVLQAFRQSGHGPQRLFTTHGLGLELVDASLLLSALVEVDDEVAADVGSTAEDQYTIRLSVERGGVAIPVVRARSSVALVRERTALSMQAPPPRLARLVVSSVDDLPSSHRRDLRMATAEDPRSALLARDPRAFYWQWQARYFHCRFSGRVQHSAYVRALEEIVDRFLTARRLSIRRMLEERGWIPVVARVRVQMLADAYMDEIVRTTFAITDVLKGMAFDARMDCYVQHGDTLRHTATAQILHGYAISDGPDAGRLTVLDPPIVSALTNGYAPCD